MPYNKLITDNFSSENHFVTFCNPHFTRFVLLLSYYCQKNFFLEEKELIRELVEGRSDAYTTLLARYEKRVFNLCLSFVPNNDDAEDIAQEVFIEVFNSVSKFRQNAKLSTWILSIAKNKCIDFIRSQNAKKRKAFRQGIFIDDVAQFENYFVDFTHSGVELESKENAMALYKAINLLPENLKVAFTLNKIDHLSYEEASEIMKCSEASVVSLVFRAKLKLREILKTYYNDNFL